MEGASPSSSSPVEAKAKNAPMYWLMMLAARHTASVGAVSYTHLPSYRVLADGTIRPVYFYCVDIAEFAVNKLVDRGSLASRGIVTNVQALSLIHI